MPRIRLEDWESLDDVDELNDTRAISKLKARSSKLQGDRRHDRPSPKRPPGGRQESFKCGHCKAFVGPTVAGGRHRNHCPLCLYSRHVDERRPGDRASACRSLMAPVGAFHRPNGEQVIVHRCRGCGLERHCRVAADDNVLACLRLPLVPPRSGASRRHADESTGEEAIA